MSRNLGPGEQWVARNDYSFLGSSEVLIMKTGDSGVAKLADDGRRVLLRITRLVTSNS